MGHHDLADFFYARGDLQVWPIRHTSCLDSHFTLP